MRATPAFAISLVAALLFPSLAAAHGGLPISENIIFQGNTLVVPTQYWGVFFGTDGGPWRWICEEAINTDQARQWSLTLDGTYHVSDYNGVTSSRDSGCTWVESTGDIAARSTSHVVADPVDGKRAWATTDAGTMLPWNALFTTDDDGITWTPALQLDEYLRGVALSSDGMRIYVTGIARNLSTSDGGVSLPPITNLHVSSDGGKTWTTHPIPYTYNGVAPYEIKPLAVDPAKPDDVYLVARVEPTSVLLRADPSGAATELTHADGLVGDDGTLKEEGILNVSFDPGDGAVLVSTRVGLLRSLAGAPLAALPGLTQAQCAIKHGNALYACSWNYCPDAKAIARSDDNGSTWSTVFEYADTLGPTQACPATSNVGLTCPGIWQMYADQLGITPGVPSPQVMCGDMGTVSSPPPPPAPSKSCDTGSQLVSRAPSAQSGAVLAAFLALSLAACFRRRAA